MNFGSPNAKRVSPYPGFTALPKAQRKTLPKRSTKKSIEREIGYGDLDDWNALPPSDKIRIRGHSVNLLHAFRLTKWFLQMLAQFPFQTKKLEDGSYTFTMSPWNLGYIIFLISSILIIIIFFLFTFGGIYIFIVFNPDEHLHDRCGNSWGKTVLSRNMPAIVFVWSQLMLTAAGSLYVIIHGRSFLDFYNVVNEAVMQLDVDPTHGVFLSTVRGLIVFGGLFIACIALAISDSLHSLTEVSVFVVQCVCYFFVKDIFTAGHKKPFTAMDYEMLLPNCSMCIGCYGRKPFKSMKICRKYKCFNNINTPSTEFIVAKWVGFAIIAYSLLGARALIRQFEFFCQILVNLAKVWNKRFLNYASKDNSVKMDDPYRRRITNQLIPKDHYEIVKLHNETEKNFSFMLFVYYSSVFFNLICQFYYFALLSTQVTCAASVGRERQAALSGKCYENATENINNTKDVLEDGLNDKHVVSFEDACSISNKTIIRHASITTFVLIIVTVTSFIITTLDADRAAHEADIGFYRVRRRGYLSCRTKKERNAMHSLVFSFTGPKPFCITAAGYFPIRKKTIIVVMSVAFIYFLIILSFKPGQNYAHVRCYTYTSGREVYQVTYPEVV